MDKQAYSLKLLPMTEVLLLVDGGPMTEILLLLDGGLMAEVLLLLDVQPDPIRGVTG